MTDTIPDQAQVRANEVGLAVRQLMGDTLGYLCAAALRVVVRFNIADRLADGPRTAAQLAESSGANADHLHRVLRFLASRGVFRLDESGAVHLTTAAALLGSDSPISMRDIIMLLTDDIYWLPAGKLDDTVAMGTTSFPNIFGSPLFEYLLDHEPVGKLFHEGLDGLSNTEHDGVAASYAFPGHGTVVDVAGGKGGLISAVLRRNPGLRGILFDQESVVAEHRLAAEPAIEGRWTVEPGDFFGSVPAGADFYLLKRILHDWNDTDALRILKSCRAAMPPHGRILIVDTVIPPGNDPHPAKLSDLAMMIVFDGKERTEPELAALCAAADLRIDRVIPSAGPLSVVEAVIA